MSHEPVSKPDQQRRDVLAPYLMRLRALQIGGACFDEIELDAWERGILEKMNGSASAPGHEWSSLVAEGVAFRTKYESDLRRLGSDPDSVDFVRAQLVTDAAVGLALMAETQQSVGLMVLSGKIDEAKKLSGFRNKIGQGVSTIKDTIGATAFRNAETISRKMTAIALQPARIDWTPATEAPVAEVPAAATQHPGEPLDVDALIGELPQALIRRQTTSARSINSQVPDVDDDGPRRIKGLAVVLAALVVIWSVLVLPRLGGGEPLPILTEQNMPQADAIRELIARPPSLFVEVDGAEWKTMSPTERRQLVEEVGEVAAASGYSGVQFRDTDGSSVAQWLQSQGVWLANPAISN